MTIHGFSVALTPGIPSPVAASRKATREAHVNVFRLGSKGLTSPVQTGDASVNAALSPGITLSFPQQAAALVNAPTELLLGETGAAPSILNMAEVDAVSTTGDMLTGFIIS